MVIVKKYQIRTCRLEFFLKTIRSAAGLFARVEYVLKWKNVYKRKVIIAFSLRYVH